MKWILRIASGSVILAMIVIAIILIPAHIQVRSVKPKLPSQGELLALTNHSDKPSNVSYLLTSKQQLERGQISHISILIEWENGSSFLIDTGMGRKQAKKFAELLKKLDSSAGSVTVNGSISELLGDAIHNIAGVGFTHLHIDHTQGIENFCNARGQGAVILQTASQNQLHNFNTSQGSELISNSCLKLANFQQNTNSNLYTSKQFSGLAAFELGGHTPGSTLWAVALGDKVLLFSGDITNNKISLDHDVPKSTLYSYVLVPENTKRTAQIRKWLNTLDQNQSLSVIVSHDLDNTKTHLSAFSKQ